MAIQRGNFAASETVVLPTLTHHPLSRNVLEDPISLLRPFISLTMVLYCHHHASNRICRTLHQDHNHRIKEISKSLSSRHNHRQTLLPLVINRFLTHLPAIVKDKPCFALLWELSAGHQQLEMLWNASCAVNQSLLYRQSKVVHIHFLLL